MNVPRQRGSPSRGQLAPLKLPRQAAGNLRSNRKNHIYAVIFKEKRVRHWSQLLHEIWFGQNDRCSDLMYVGRTRGSPAGRLDRHANDQTRGLKRRRRPKSVDCHRRTPLHRGRIRSKCRVCRLLGTPPCDLHRRSSNHDGETRSKPLESRLK